MKATVSTLSLLLALSALVFVAAGCVSPLSWEQQSDWNWKQYNPEYRAPYPADPGWGSR